MNISIHKNHKKTVPFCELVPGDIFLLPSAELKYQDQVHVFLKIEEIPDSWCVTLVNMVDLTTNQIGFVCEPLKEVIRIEKEDIKFEINY